MESALTNLVPPYESRPIRQDKLYVPIGLVVNYFNPNRERLTDLSYILIVYAPCRNAKDPHSSDRLLTAGSEVCLLLCQ